GAARPPRRPESPRGDAVSGARPHRQAALSPLALGRRRRAARLLLYDAPDRRRGAARLLHEPCRTAGPLLLDHTGQPDRLLHHLPAVLPVHLPAHRLASGGARAP